MKKKLIAVGIASAVLRNVGYAFVHAVPCQYLWLLYAALIALDVESAVALIKLGAHGCMMSLLDDPGKVRALYKIVAANGGEEHAADEA